MGVSVVIRAGSWHSLLSPPLLSWLWHPSLRGRSPRSSGMLRWGQVSGLSPVPLPLWPIRRGFSRSSYNPHLRNRPKFPGSGTCTNVNIYCDVLIQQHKRDWV